MKKDRIFAKKSLGQNFIHDKNFLLQLSSLIKTNSKLSVIEIGPGKGALTKQFFQKKIKEITLIEKDSSLICELEKFKLDFPNLNIINKDALNINYNTFIKKNSIIVGNLPFNISIELLLKWIFLEKWPPNYVKMYLMFQKEVAERILAKPCTKKYGRLSVITQSRCKIKKLIVARSKIFYPVPKVDGVVLELTPHDKNNNVNIDNLEILVRKSFSQRRKKIKTTLSQYTKLLNNLSIDINLRPEQISVLDYCKIAKLMK